MSQALHTSSTGINSGQAQINVIANNVANINTTGFKAANMTFETLYSNNLSYGSAASKNGGGTNPKQIGYGVKVGGITRNFAPGSFVQTGRNLDTMISGNGFYVVKDANGAPYFTRDGIFSVDSAGNIVTQSGFKVSAAKSAYSNSGSDMTIKIPTDLIAKVYGDPDLGEKTLASLNNASITGGTIAATVNGEDVVLEIKQTDPTKSVGDLTVQQVVDAFNAQIKAQTSITANVFTIANGTIKYDPATYNFTFSSEGTTSNFLGETGLSSTKSTSYELNQKVDLLDMVNYNDTSAISLNGVAVDNNGIMIATYSNGSILTQFLDNADTLQWKYTTEEGVVITGDDVTEGGSSIANSHFAIELATMVNEEGLVSMNNNLWKWGPNVGEIYYGIAGEMSFGAIESGGYEESNVDIAHELSTMISAQRMIQMNSRVFSTASSVMETLAYLGS